MKKINLNIHRLIASVIVLLIVGFNIFLFSDTFFSEELRIHTDRGIFKVKVEIADNPQERAHGLMGRRRLDVGRGMLFVYSDSFLPSFWMKNTLIPLDMIFIDKIGFIRTIREKAPPCPPELGNDCPQYTPDVPVQYVLEVPGGYSALFGVKTGDRVDLPLVKEE